MHLLTAAGMTEFQALVYRATKRIPKGRVASYGTVAKAVGKPAAARAVGGALNKNTFKSVPCHRVVCSDGLAGGFARGPRAKIRILKKEGIVIKNNKIGERFLLYHL